MKTAAQVADMSDPESQKLQSILYMKDLDLESQHVPQCADFVVYIFKKKSKSMRVLR